MDEREAARDSGLLARTA